MQVKIIILTNISLLCSWTIHTADSNIGRMADALYNNPPPVHIAGDFVQHPITVQAALPPEYFSAAALRGILSGVEGGLGLLVKTLILTLPALGFNKLYAWYTNTHRQLKEEDMLVNDTRVMLLRLKKIQAEGELAKAVAQLDTLNKTLNKQAQNHL